MEIKEQIKLRFTGVDFPSVTVHSIQSYKESDEVKLKVNIKPKVFIPKDYTNKFNIIMNVEIAAEGFFNLLVVAVGYFELSKEDISEEVRNSFINENSPAIVFPYVRSFISTLTSNLGNVTTPIILPTRFFKGELEHIVVPEEK